MDEFYIVALISVIAGGIAFIFTSNIKRKKYQKELFKLEQDKELFSYYLKNELPKESIERYINNSLYFKQSNFEYEYGEKLLFEISRLRREIGKLNDKSPKISEEKKKTEKRDEEFDYKQLVIELSNMTNIQYLFELLNKNQEEKMEHVKNVLADIVHTIRTPVSGIKALVEIIKIEEHTEELTNKIADINNYIEQIEDNLNAYYEISHLATVSNNEAMVDLVKEIKARSRLFVISSGKIINLKITELEIQLEKKVAEVLLLAIMCILENAIMFSPDNGDVIISIEKEHTQITVEIENGGPVIESDVMMKIFRQGFSTRGSTGRGLVIAKKAIEEMLNGVILCENTGKKTGVKFSIIAEVDTND